MGQIVIRPKSNTGTDVKSVAFTGHVEVDGDRPRFITDDDAPNFDLQLDGEVPTVDMIAAQSQLRFIDYGVVYRIDGYCLDHQSRVPSGYNTCPMCLEERRVERMEREMHERRSDPRMHPSVDARRY